jgi:hypothetical protein
LLTLATLTALFGKERSKKVRLFFATASRLHSFACLWGLDIVTVKIQQTEWDAGDAYLNY